MKKPSKNPRMNVFLLGMITISLPIQAFAITSVRVSNSLHAAKDTQTLGPTVTPVNVLFYASAGTATAPCDKILGLQSGSDYTSTIGASGKCSAIYHFVTTPLASTITGMYYPYGSTSVDTIVNTTGAPAPVYIITDSGAGTAGTAGSLLNGMPVCSSAGSSAGSGDVSIPPTLDTSATTGTALVMCQGTMAIKQIV